VVVKADDGGVVHTCVGSTPGSGADGSAPTLDSAS
jgi:hypothetical protein